MARAGNPRGSKRVPDPTGIGEIDALPLECSVQRYLVAAAAYVRESHRLAAGPKKAGQIRLSNALGRALVGDLRQRLPHLSRVTVGECKVAGALRTTNAD